VIDAKTGVDVFCPLPPEVVAALGAIPEGSRWHFVDLFLRMEVLMNGRPDPRLSRNTRMSCSASGNSVHTSRVGVRELEVTIDGATQVVRAGLVAIVPVKALTDGRAIIVDYPLRREFN